MSDELKPCPFCDSREIHYAFNYRKYTVTCRNCLVDCGEHDTPERAAFVWNTRPLEDEKDKQIAELKAELSRNADEGYVGFMLGIEQMKKKIAEKDKEIERLKHKLNNIKDTLTKYHDVSLSKINAKEAEGVHFFVFKFSSALLEIINDTNNNGGSMAKE